jgi:hypothetical protein
MTNTVTARLGGGLGNMLFQLAAAYAISIRDNMNFICDGNDISSVHGEYTNYLNNIFRNFIIRNDLNISDYYGEINFSYNQIPKFNTSFRLIGYFQSEKYFKDYRDEILKLFQIDEETSKYLNEKYGDLLKLKTCSVHVRRGDYVWQQEYHPVLDIEYYKNAITHFDEDTHFLIFSTDIEWCEENFDFIKNKTYISDNQNYQELYLMSLCNHNIIANSSFSWWGAWLNQNENKKVISPQRWFGDRLPLNTNDLYCENWIKI